MKTLKKEYRKPEAVIFVLEAAYTDTISASDDYVDDIFPE